jgi:hypothetical protein
MRRLCISWVKVFVSVGVTTAYFFANTVEVKVMHLLADSHVPQALILGEDAEQSLDSPEDFLRHLMPWSRSAARSNFSESMVLKV